MADHFADRYWSTQFWPTRYFMAGEVDPNAMSASIAAGATLTGTLTTGETLEQILGSAARWKPKKAKKPTIPEIDIAEEDDFILTQVIEYLSRAA